LTEIAPRVPPGQEEAWQAAAQSCLESPREAGSKREALLEQWYVLVECRDERQQVALPRRFQAEGLTCVDVLRVHRLLQPRQLPPQGARPPPR
jgi:hypothetical protein